MSDACGANQGCRGAPTATGKVRTDRRAGVLANGPLAVAATKRILVEARDWSRADEFERQRDISLAVRESADGREGALAFKEKRAPHWSGH